MKQSKNSLLEIVTGFIKSLPAHIASTLFTRSDINLIEGQIRADLEFYTRTDPAAHGSAEMVQNAYLSFRAVAAYRIAHHIVKKAMIKGNEQFNEYARLISEKAKVFTGVEIHPAATIRSPFMIDHGWGVVIGETAEVGSHCCLLNGVVLGARGIAGNPTGKRHPTLGDHVQVGAFTEILGDIHIGNNTIIGPRLKVTSPIPANSVLIRKTEYWTLRCAEPCIYSL